MNMMTGTRGVQWVAVLGILAGCAAESGKGAARGADAAQSVGPAPEIEAGTAQAITSGTVAVPGDGSIRFESRADGVSLAGSVYRPVTRPVSGVVLLGVAGPNDRHLTLGSLEPFRAVAESLRAVGVAVLAYDDRGVGESEDDWSRAGYETLVTDALSARSALSRAVGLDEVRIGFFGLSEGSGIALMAAAQAPDVPFLVLGSPPGLMGESALRAQLEARLRGAGLTGEAARPYHAAFDRFVELARTAGSDSTVMETFAGFLAGPGAALIPPYRFVPTAPRERAELFSSPWYRSQLDYDPTMFLRDVDAPVLVVGGALDPILPPALHHPPLDEGLGPGDRVFAVLPGVNHLLLPARTGLPAEYGEIQEPIAPGVMELVTEWLAARGWAKASGPGTVPPGAASQPDE